MAQTTTRKRMAEFLESHPRTMGALFTVCLLLMQAGNVAANGASAYSGP
ncbi:hypothetical protein M0R88_17300 [Halorussus gelatinilyticus]|uniref:Uncharacterized protein n=1 Tax=Halorussus gelatinilyticus TaxID=2937524 RepID=A0A8U0IIZ6_9EURY|nr:hypothetical protein [Halorussus gelatinilyticus]UPW00252.1 hypothetical protein M0R88_17300 [Halorussus gelatinilyticus]